MIEFLNKHRKEVLVILCWLIVSSIYFYSMLVFILNNNLFSWNFSHSIITYVSILLILFMLFLMLLLAKKTLTVISLIVSFIIVLLFALLAVLSIIPDSDTVLRSVASPIIFRLTLLIFYIAPLLIWLAYPLQYFRKRNSKQ